jgi:hypothetical protein
MDGEDGVNRDVTAAQMDVSASRRHGSDVAFHAAISRALIQR